jgi:cysteine-rich repeat protein
MRFIGMCALIVAVGFAACSSENAAPRLCTPGAYSACQCQPGGEEGTKLCAEDGASYGACERCGQTPSDDAAVAADAQIDATASADAAASPNFCPGTPVVVDGTKDVTLSGDLTGLRGNYVGEGACAGATGPEAVFALKSTTGGHLTAKVTGGGAFIPYARVDSCTKGRQVGCGMGTAGFDVVAGWSYSLFADSAPNSTGPFTLTLHLTPGPVCGDGHVDPGEACDDGNDIDGDGCDHTCNPDGNVYAYGYCPGQPIHVWTTAVRYIGETSTLPVSNNLAGACGGYGSHDHVFMVTPHQNGRLYATVFNASFQAIVSARSGACDSGTEMGCMRANGPPADGGTVSAALIVNAVTAGQTYWVIVNGASATSDGSFTLDLGVY